VHGKVNGVAVLVRRETPGSPGHDEAGGQPLDVPFERSGERLVKVVDVEEQVALR